MQLSSKSRHEVFLKGGFGLLFYDSNQTSPDMTHTHEKAEKTQNPTAKAQGAAETETATENGHAQCDLNLGG